MRSLPLLVLALAISGCRGEEVPLDPEVYERAGAEKQAEGRWWPAAAAYGRAYALLVSRGSDAQDDARLAGLALERGRMLARGGDPGGGLDWLAQALRLDPTRAVAHLEAAYVHDGVHGASEAELDAVDPVAAHAAYLRFLDAPTEDGVSAGEIQRVRDRVAALEAAGVAVPSDGGR